MQRWGVKPLGPCQLYWKSWTDLPHLCSQRAKAAIEDAAHTGKKRNVVVSGATNGTTKWPLPHRAPEIKLHHPPPACAKRKFYASNIFCVGSSHTKWRFHLSKKAWHGGIQPNEMVHSCSPAHHTQAHLRHEYREIIVQEGQVVCAASQENGATN